MGSSDFCITSPPELTILTTAASGPMPLATSFEPWIRELVQKDTDAVFRLAVALLGYTREQALVIGMFGLVRVVESVIDRLRSRSYPFPRSL